MSSLRGEIEHFLITKLGVNEYYFTDFEFVVGVTPLSSIYYPLCTVLIYCIGVPLLQDYMINRKSPSLKYILIFHNLFLSLISLFMSIFLFSTILSYSYKYTYHEIFCSLSHHNQKGTLTLIYFVNYILKYYELFDTLFLILKHKSISFLHGYHHPATLVLTWGQLVDSTGMQWLMIFLNLNVHTVMYFYYFINASKLYIFKPKKWKQLVTIMQILQFIIDLFAGYYGCFANRMYNKCIGTPRSAAVGLFILTSYLYLFVDFFDITYKNKNNKMSQLFFTLLVLFASIFIYLITTYIDVKMWINVMLFSDIN